MSRGSGPAARWLLAGLVLLGAGVSAAALVGRGAAVARDRALLIAQTERFGPGTRGRVAAWVEATAPHTPVRWSAGDAPLLGDRVPVALHIGDRGPYRFEIHLADRAVVPLDDETRELVRRISMWAAAPGGK